MSQAAPATRADLEAHQLAELNALLAALVPSNAFYAPRIRAAGLDRGADGLETFRHRMPFTLKEDLVGDQTEHPPYGSNLTLAPDRYTRLHQTSSTSGHRPLRWLDDAAGWSWMIDGWVEVLEAADITARDRVFVATAFGPFIGLWMAFEAAVRLGCLTIPGGAMSSATRLRVMMANDVTALCCTPTYAIHLGEVARREGIDLARGRVRSIVVGGEPGASVAGTRRYMESLWPGARVHDHYGMTEVGPVTFQCQHRTDAMHAREQAYLCEVVDPASGEPLAPGSTEPGELVLTTLGRSASPVLRYRTGDLVRPAADPACACGRCTLLLEGGIIRRDDMVFVRGVNLYPSAVDEIVRGVDGVAEYRVEIDESPALTEVRVLVEPEPDADAAAICHALQQAFRDVYSLRVSAVPVDPETLPRFELKARRWIRTARAAAADAGGSS